LCIFEKSVPKTLSTDSGNATMVSRGNNKKVRFLPSPWIIIGAAAILLVIVIVLALANINREKRYMSSILVEKGAALIKAFEAGARTGMMGMRWGGHQVQRLLEETASQPDILYLMVTDADGKILAHSEPSRIGRRLQVPLPPMASGTQNREQWRLTTLAGGKQAFEVYRYFRPLSRPGRGKRRGENALGSMPMMPGHNASWCFSGPGAPEKQLIFIGLDVAPFLEARRQDIRNTVVISAMLVLLGFGGFVSLFWMQSYRLAKRSLQDTSAFADEVVSHLPVGLVATDRDGAIAVFNAAAESITGVSLSTALGQQPDAVLPAHWCGLQSFLNQGLTVVEKEMECAFAGGRVVPVSVSATRIVNEDGKFVGNVLIFRDLGELRRLQDQMRRKEKLAAIGGLAAGVAHEIRNPLSSIKGMATYFAGRFASDSPDREAANVMISEVNRLNRVVTELLEFARPSELKPQRVNLNELISHCLRLVDSDLKAKAISVDWRPGTEISVQLDADRFSQCLLNLYLNAIEAMEPGGTLTVSCTNGPESTVSVEVADTGAGIAPQDISQIFDPYFTTKASGTGLGLAVVHKVIEAHGGRIFVASTPGEKTVFTITLPV
jgi:two-component system sensor histidine kinase HydH